MKVLARFFELSRPQRGWMLAGIALGVLVISANTLLMAVSGWFIASMAVSGSSGIAFNYFFPSASIRFLAIARTVGRYAERLVTHEATFRVLAELRVWLFKRIEPLSPAGLESYGGGDVAGRVRADVDALETLYLKIVAPLAVGIISALAALLFLLVFSPPSAAVVLPFLVLCGLCLPLLVHRLSAAPGQRSATLAAELRNSVTEGLRGVEELILLGAVERQAARVDQLSSALIDEQERLGRIQGVSLAGMVFCSGSAVAAVLLVGAMQVAARQIPPANLVMLLLFSAAAFEAAGPLASAFLHLPAARESAARLFELADTPIPVAEALFPRELPSRCDLCFSQVSAGYHADVQVLKNLNFALPAGGRMVLSGPSGAGKSLLAEILLRFRNYDGSITVGGVEIRDLPKDALRTLIAAVPQQPYLFNGTIRDNILLGREAASAADLTQALHDSCLDSWINVLPLGLDTSVGIQGSQVSGGEARRIALARALLKNAPILLLDEPTEGLDGHTERELIQRLAQRLSASAVTTMVISHRPACRALGDSFLHLQRPRI